MEVIIQGARTEARKLIFGDADKNVGYVFIVKEDLQKAGHYVELSFTTHKAARTTNDLPNATILLLKLECTWFNKMKQEAWGGNSILTPRGIDKYDATFTNLNSSQFLYHLRD